MRYRGNQDGGGITLRSTSGRVHTTKFQKIRTIFFAAVLAVLLCSCALDQPSFNDVFPSPPTAAQQEAPLGEPDEAHAFLAKTIHDRGPLATAETVEPAAPSVELIDKSLFPYANPEMIKSSRPTAHSEYLLREEMVVNPRVFETVRESGLPDAVEIEFAYGLAVAPANQSFAMYYRNPPRTFIFHKDQELTLADVPRSVRILTFKEPIPATPWPTTITPEARNLMDVRATASSPPVTLNTADFISDSTYIGAHLDDSTDSGARTRAEAALARLAPASAVDGVSWRVVVFKYAGQSAFAVPDGTLFLSDALIDALNNTSLTIVIAHLMGHVRYGHYSPWAGLTYSGDTCAAHMIESELLAPLVGLGIGGAGAGGGVLLGLLLPAAAPVAMAINHKRLCNPNLSLNEAWQVRDAKEAPKTDDAKEAPKADGAKAVDDVGVRRRELEADYAAAGYLARIGISPAQLIETMGRVNLETVPLDPPRDTKLYYSLIESHGDNGAADLGRLLDAGSITPQSMTASQ